MSIPVCNTARSASNSCTSLRSSRNIQAKGRNHSVRQVSSQSNLSHECPRRTWASSWVRMEGVEPSSFASSTHLIHEQEFFSSGLLRMCTLSRSSISVERRMRRMKPTREWRYASQKAMVTRVYVPMNTVGQWKEPGLLDCCIVIVRLHDDDCAIAASSSCNRLIWVD